MCHMSSVCPYLNPNTLEEPPHEDGMETPCHSFGVPVELVVSFRNLCSERNRKRKLIETSVMDFNFRLLYLDADDKREVLRDPWTGLLASIKVDEDTGDNIIKFFKTQGDDHPGTHMSTTTRLVKKNLYNLPITRTMTVADFSYSGSGKFPATYGITVLTNTADVGIVKQSVFGLEKSQEMDRMVKEIRRLIKDRKNTSASSESENDEGDENSELSSTASSLSPPAALPVAQPSSPPQQ